MKKKLYRALSVYSQIALAVFLVTFAGGRLLQEADGRIPYQNASSDDAASQRQQDSDAWAEACTVNADNSGDSFDCESAYEYMPRATLSPSMRELEQAIGQLRVAGFGLANAAATGDGTLPAAAADYRNALTQAREIFGKIRLYMDDADLYFDGAEGCQTALIGRRGEIRFQADELRLLSVQ